MYAAKGGANPEQVLSMTWNYSTPHEPASEEVAMESNGKALADYRPGNRCSRWRRTSNSSFFAAADDGTASAAVGFCR
jgi:formate dehydrogenase major subunit